MNEEKRGSKLNRRDFLARTGRGLVGVAMMPLLRPMSLLGAQAGGKKLGVALVGLGNYARGQLGPALLETEHCYLAGIVTGTKAKEKTWSDQYSIKPENIYNYDNFDAIKSNPGIDIVYVVLPNSMHAEFTIRAANAGKHVICEKPMALTVADCQKMIDACNKNGVKLSIGYRLHFEPHHRKIMDLAQEKPFGEIKFMQSEFGFQIGDPGQWRLRKAMAGGGAVMDVGIYCIQAACYALGQDPIAVTAREYKTDFEKFKEVDETVVWQLEFPGGAIASSATSYATQMSRLFVSAGRATYELRSAYFYGGISGSIYGQAMSFPQVNQQAKQMDAFALNIKNDTASIVSGDMGLRDMKIIEALYKSIAGGGQRVEI